MKTLRKMLRAYTRYMKYRQITSELYALSDKDLADIGISRGDIPHVAWKGNR